MRYRLRTPLPDLGMRVVDIAHDQSSFVLGSGSSFMTIVQSGVERLSSLRSRFFRLIASLAAAGTVVVVGLTLSGFAARWWWRFEQACPFRVQYFWLLALASVV